MLDDVVYNTVTETQKENVMNQEVITNIEILIETAYQEFLKRGIKKDVAQQALNTIQFHLLEEQETNPNVHITYQPIVSEIDGWLAGAITFNDSDYDVGFFYNIFLKLGGSWLGGYAK